jgi:hypothetical protein
MEAFGPDGRPAVFDGGVWRSHDGRFSWNGVAWVPTNVSVQPAQGPWLVKLGISAVLVALLGYAVFTTIATKSEYSIGYSIGVVLFFVTLVAIYRFAGEWGLFGMLVRAGCAFLAALKVLTLFVHPPTA